jgi:DNA-binding CsgD family transcriptional regulator
MPVAAVQPARISIIEAPPAAVIRLDERRGPRVTDGLTQRERQVLDQLARGDRTEDMAAALHLSTHTIRTHVKTLLRKLGARTRAHAVAIAYADGGVAPS